MLKSHSPVHALLCLPAIGGDGIEHSVVFAVLPAAAQSAIRMAANEEAKRGIAAAAGDRLPVIGQMYQHYIAAPLKRQQAGMAFPALESLSDFPLPGLLTDEDRSWLRPGQRIEAIDTAQRGDGWSVTVRYADGQELEVCGARGAIHASKTEAEERKCRVHIAAFILGLIGREQ